MKSNNNLFLKGKFWINYKNKRMDVSQSSISKQTKCK